MSETINRKDRLFVNSFVLLLFSLFVLIFWKNDIHSLTKYICYITTTAGTIGVFVFSHRGKTSQNR
jgi:sugar phosphate permease